MSERFFYSAKSNGFYLYSLMNDYQEAGNWPVDAVEISERWYTYLLDGQSTGKIICSNEYGSPVLSDPPPPTPEQVIANAEAQKSDLMRIASDAIIPLQDAIDLGIETEQERQLWLKWKGYRVAINRIDPSQAPNIDWPEEPQSVA